MWVVPVCCAFACYIQSWFRFAVSLVKGWFSVGSDLGQVWFRFGSSLFQVWFRFGSGLVHVLWSIGSTGPSGLEGLLDKHGFHMYGKIVP